MIRRSAEAETELVYSYIAAAIETNHPEQAERPNVPFYVVSCDSCGATIEYLEMFGGKLLPGSTPGTYCTLNGGDFPAAINHAYQCELCAIETITG